MCIQDKKQRLEPDMEQWTGLKLGKEYIKAVYCHSAYLTCMQNTSCGNARLDESQAGVEIVGRNINSLRYAADTLMGASLVAQTVKKKNKKTYLHCGRPGFDPGLRRSSGGGHGYPIFLPGKFQVQRSLAGNSLVLPQSRLRE